MPEALVPEWALDILGCPACRKGRLALHGTDLACACGRRFSAAVVPILTIEAPAGDTDEGPLPSAEFTARWQRRRGGQWIGDDMIAALPAGACVLSAGEGYGELVLVLARRRPDVHFIAVDLSARRTEGAIAARRRLGIDNVWFCVADVMRLPFADRAFSAGYARGLLHVLPRPQQAIAELRRVVTTRLLVDQLANDPWGVVWFWLLQRYENVRARIARRPPDPRIFGEVRATRRRRRAFLPLLGYRRWFQGVRRATVRANCVFVWETGRHHGVLGWVGYAGAVDVWL